MDKNILQSTVRQLLTEGKGLVAADESNASCKKRFDAVGIPSTPEERRRYRQILITTESINSFVSGIILYDETFWQMADNGESFTELLLKSNILPGIKVDQGLVDLPGFDGEKISEGLDGLVLKMQNYAHAGAKFAKWRSVFSISDKTPSEACIDANAYVLARYARICQEANIVPIVEPEVLLDGSHSIEQCQDTMQKVFTMTFDLLKYYKVFLPGLVIKTSMVLAGKESSYAMNHNDVALRTANVLKNFLPNDLGGVVFLSGGQSPKDAFVNLSKIKQNGPFNWGVTFSFSRAIQDPVLKSWAKTRDLQISKSVYFNQLSIAQQSAQGKLDENINIDSFVTASQDL